MPGGQLDEGASGTLNASGRLVLTIGPRTPRTRWRVSNVAVSGTSATDTEARLYLGPEAPQNLLAGTYSGNRDSVPTGVTLTPGQILTVVWTNGTPGGRQAVSIYGSFDVAGGGR